MFIISPEKMDIHPSDNYSHIYYTECTHTNTYHIPILAGGGHLGLVCVLDLYERFNHTYTHRNQAYSFIMADIWAKEVWLLSFELRYDQTLSCWTCV